MLMAKTKIGSWFASRDWSALVDFVVKWLLVPSTAVGGYLAHDSVSNFINSF